MSFHSYRTYLENAFDVLQQQSASTIENWEDPVQRRFYEQFINSLPKEIHAYLTELTKLDKSFEKAEQAINNLQK